MAELLKVGSKVRLIGEDPSLGIDLGKLGLTGVITEVHPHTSYGKAVYLVKSTEAPDWFKKKCNKLGYLWDEVVVFEDEVEPLD